MKLTSPQRLAVLAATLAGFAATAMPRHASGDETAAQPDVTAAPDPAPPPGATARADAPTTSSIWDGVFTDAQARRGAIAYTGPCSHCHGYRLNGAPDDPDMISTPPLAGAKFLRDWDGRSLAALFEYTRATMPENNPSYLSNREYADIMAYMLAASGVPAGEDELEGDASGLARIAIRQRP